MRSNLETLEQQYRELEQAESQLRQVQSGLGQLNAARAQLINTVDSLSALATAIEAVLARGRVGQTYNIGGNAERKNIDVVKAICAAMDRALPDPEGSYERLITFVADRAGHDFRYAINSSKLENELGWRRAYAFESGLAKTVDWYLQNGPWLAAVQSGEYRKWLDMNYGARRG